MFFGVSFVGGIGLLPGIVFGFTIMPFLHLVFKVIKPLTALDIFKSTGFNTWLKNIAENHRWLYGLMGLVLVAIIALTLSFVTDWIMNKLGYRSEKIDNLE
jgi:hypothetical protein